MANATISQIVSRVQRKLREYQFDPDKIEALVPDIEANIPDACAALADLAMVDPIIRGLLTKSYSFTVTSNVADLTGATYDDLLWSSLPEATITVTDLSPDLNYYRSRRDMNLGTVHSDLPRYCVVGRKLNIRLEASQSIVDGTGGTIHDAVFEPVVASSAGSTTLPPDLEPQLVDLLASPYLAAEAG